MLKPIHANFGARLCTRVQFLGHRGKARNRRRITTQRYGVAAVNGRDGNWWPRTLAPALTSQPLKRGGNFTRTGIIERDNLGRGAVAVNLTQQIADAANIVGIICNHKAVCILVRCQRTFAAYQWTQRFHS
jgi:hypothetical protein